MSANQGSSGKLADRLIGWISQRFPKVRLWLTRQRQLVNAVSSLTERVESLQERLKLSKEDKATLKEGRDILEKSLKTYQDALKTHEARISRLRKEIRSGTARRVKEPRERLKLLREMVDALREGNLLIDASTGLIKSLPPRANHAYVAWLYSHKGKTAVESSAAAIRIASKEFENQQRSFSALARALKQGWVARLSADGEQTD